MAKPHAVELLDDVQVESGSAMPFDIDMSITKLSFGDNRGRQGSLRGGPRTIAWVYARDWAKGKRATARGTSRQDRLSSQAGKITDPVSIGILKCRHIEAVQDGVLVPEDMVIVVHGSL